MRDESFKDRGVEVTLLVERGNDGGQDALERLHGLLLFSCKAEADREGGFERFADCGEEAGFAVDGVGLDGVVVLAAYEHEFAVWRDDEATGDAADFLVCNFGEGLAGFEDGDGVGTPVGGVDELLVFVGDDFGGGGFAGEAGGEGADGFEELAVFEDADRGG